MAINITLLYYNKNQITSGVGLLSGEFAPVKYLFNEVELPSWNVLVLNTQQRMEDEIQQIISLNYPHVQSIVFENLREVLSDIRIKSVNKDLITHIADEVNESERLRLLKQPNGFAVSVNKDFLPKYFAVVENAISNLKRIINKYLNLYDTDKLPKSYQPPNYLPINTTPLVNDREEKRLKVNMTVEQLAFLFRILKDSGLVMGADKEIARFIVDHFETTARQGKKISADNLRKLFSTKNPDIVNFWIAHFKKMQEKTERK
jgi:hypothetical protein